MYQESMAANAAQEPAQTSFATEETALATPGMAEADENAAAAQDPAETAQLTRAFSERLKVMSGKKVDEFIAGMGLRDHTGEPIRTRAQYENWQAAQNLSAVPSAADTALGEAADELGRLRGELARLHDDERDRALLADPEQGGTYARLRDKVQQLQKHCRADGTDTRLDAVYAAVLLKELPALCREAAENGRSQALRTVQANGQASPGALGGGGAPQTLDFERMSSADFAEYHRRALRGDWS